MTRTQQARTVIDGCIGLYKTIGIDRYELVEHPDLPGRWLLILHCVELTQDIFAAVSTIWLITKKEWFGLAGIQLNDLTPLPAESLNLVSALSQPRW